MAVDLADFRLPGDEINQVLRDAAKVLIGRRLPRNGLRDVSKDKRRDTEPIGRRGMQGRDSERGRNRPVRCLVVVADDFGIGPATSRGILDLAAKGLVTGTVLLVNSPYAEEA